jgi:predicted nucleic acid-binding protein
MRWFYSVSVGELYTSVLVLAEIRGGVIALQRRDPEQAKRLERRMLQFESLFVGRILPITRSVAFAWAEMNVPNRLPVIDGLLAATAKVHDLTLVTRNTKDVERSGAKLLNPFEFTHHAT